MRLSNILSACAFVCIAQVSRGFEHNHPREVPAYTSSSPDLGSPYSVSQSKPPASLSAVLGSAVSYGSNLPNSPLSTLYSTSIGSPASSPTLTSASSTSMSTYYSNSSSTYVPTEVCKGNCLVDVPWLTTYYWSPYYFSTTITAATVIKLINDRTNQTSYITQYATLPAHHNTTAIRNTNAEGTVMRTVVRPRKEGSSTTILAFPTVFMDYGDDYAWFGVLPTTDPRTQDPATCSRLYSDFPTNATTQTITLPSHPMWSPQPSVSYPHPQDDTKEPIDYHGTLFSPATEAWPMSTQWFIKRFPTELPFQYCSLPLYPAPAQIIQTARYLTATKVSHIGGDDSTVPQTSSGGPQNTGQGTKTSLGAQQNPTSTRGGGLVGLINSIIGNGQPTTNTAVPQTQGYGSSAGGNTASQGSNPHATQNNGQSRPTDGEGPPTSVPGTPPTQDGQNSPTAQRESSPATTGTNDGGSRAATRSVTGGPPVLTVGGQTLTATTNSEGSTAFILPGSSTLTAGGVVTFGSTTISLPSGGTNIVVNGQTTPIDGSVNPQPTPSTAPVLTIDGTTYRPIISGSSTAYALPSTTLTPGGSAVISGTTYSLPSGSASVLIVNGKTSTIAGTTSTKTTGLGGFINSGLGGSGGPATNTVAPTFDGSARGMLEDLSLGMVCCALLCIAVMML